MSKRDYEWSKPLPMHLNVTPDTAAYYVRRSLASWLCKHDPLQPDLDRPCKKCLATIEPLVLPVAKALTWAIVEARIAAGSAIEQLIRDADFELDQFRRKITPVKSEPVADMEPQDA